MNTMSKVMGIPILHHGADRKGKIVTITGLIQLILSIRTFSSHTPSGNSIALSPLLPRGISCLSISFFKRSYRRWNVIIPFMLQRKSELASIRLFVTILKGRSAPIRQNLPKLPQIFIVFVFFFNLLWLKADIMLLLHYICISCFRNWRLSFGQRKF